MIWLSFANSNNTFGRLVSLGFASGTNHTFGIITTLTRELLNAPLDCSLFYTFHYFKLLNLKKNIIVFIGDKIGENIATKKLSIYDP